MPLTAGVINFALSVNVPGTATLPGYGHDLSCANDLDPGMVEVDGVTVLSQALYRRIITPRGTLLDDQNYGFDVTAYLNEDVSPGDVGRIGSQVDAEFLKDERVIRSTTTVTFVASGLLTVSSVVTPSLGPAFNLVIAVGQASAQILTAPT